MNEKRAFLKKEYLPLIDTIDASKEGNFGLMTPQHMIEHMTQVFKASTKRYGEPEGEPTKSALGFKRFIAKGAVLKYRPSDKTKADLPALKYETFEEAKAALLEGVNRFYAHYDANADFLSYSPVMGEFSFDEWELFHYMHARHHLYQFSAIAVYP